MIKLLCEKCGNKIEIMSKYAWECLSCGVVGHTKIPLNRFLMPSEEDYKEMVANDQTHKIVGLTIKF